jgi:phage terminase large subunit GpA-like protein
MRFLVLGEVDKYPVDVSKEGSPLDKADARSRTFGFRRKKVVLSTPGEKVTSVVYAEYLRGDQRHWCMPCPHCAWGEAGSRFEGKGTVYHPEFFRHTPKKPRTAHMVCRNCEGRIDEDRHKTEMLAHGRWIPTAENQDDYIHRSYYMPSYISPIGWLSWAQIASMKDRAAGNYARSKVFCNSVDGMPWEDAGSAPDWEFVYGRRSKGYRRRQLPRGVLFLTCGGDVGVDHVELHVWGWCHDNRRWLIESVRISGRTTEPETWDRVREVLRRRYLHPVGAVLPIRRTGIDRGHLPEIVDAFVQTCDP